MYSLPQVFVQPEPIVFGTAARKFQFTNPVLFPAPERSLLRHWIPPLQGVYAILVPDASWNPRPFRLLYIGEATDLHERLTPNHEKFTAWKGAALGRQLYVSHMTTVGSSDSDRREMESFLIGAYIPPCNDRLPTLSRLSLFSQL